MRRRGFTLLEALLTAFLVAFLLGIFANLVQGYSSVLRFVSRKDRTLSGLKSGLLCAQSEFGSAVQVLAPNSGTPVGTLDFYKIDPSYANRFTVSKTTWEPLNPAAQVHIRYYLVMDQLVRECTVPGGQPVVEAVAEGVTGFTTSLLAGGMVELKASFQEDKIVQVFTLHLLRWPLQ